MYDVKNSIYSKRFQKGFQRVSHGSRGWKRVPEDPEGSMWFQRIQEDPKGYQRIPEDPRGCQRNLEFQGTPRDSR